jgi:D-alanine-D-alanine ligase
MKVLVLHQGDIRLATDNALVRNAVATERALSDALRQLGAVPVSVLLDERLDFCRVVREEGPDLVFNACDLGLACDPTYEPHVAAVLDTLHIPYTGSSHLALALTNDKVWCRRLLGCANVLTPRAVPLLAGRPAPTIDVAPPVICKPLRNHNSIDVDFDSVWHDERSIGRRVEQIVHGTKDFLLEEYIDGREIIGAFVGNGAELRLLPFEEIAFGEFFRGKPKILTYDSKWDVTSRACLESTVVIPAPLSPGLQEGLSALVATVARVFDIRDYGRVDFRVDGDGRTFVIDVNTNPDIGPGAGLAQMAHAGGLDYPGLIDAIVTSALRRAKG